MSEPLENFKKDAEKAKDQVVENEFVKDDKKEDDKKQSIKEDIQKTFE